MSVCQYNSKLRQGLNAKNILPNGKKCVSLQSKTNRELNMQTAANHQYMSAVDALWTLYQQQSQRVREAFRNRIAQDEMQESERFKPYTMEEVNAMLDEAEANFAAGRGIPHEESMRRLDEKITRWKQEKYEMAEAV